MKHGLFSVVLFLSIINVVGLGKASASSLDEAQNSNTVTAPTVIDQDTTSEVVVDDESEDKGIRWRCRQQCWYPNGGYAVAYDHCRGYAVVCTGGCSPFPWVHASCIK